MLSFLCAKRRKQPNHAATLGLLVWHVSPGRNQGGKAVCSRPRASARKLSAPEMTADSLCIIKHHTKWHNNVMGVVSFYFVTHPPYSRLTQRCTLPEDPTPCMQAINDDQDWQNHKSCRTQKSRWRANGKVALTRTQNKTP